MITLIDLTKQLNDFLQIGSFVDFCPNGLQVEGKREVHKVATAVTSSLHVIEEAIIRQADVLIVHHGIFWNRDSPVISGTKREKIALLLKHGISLVAYHLPLDAHREIGNNWKAAIDLGWSDLEPFYQENKQWIGVRGRIKPQSRSSLQASLEAYYGQKATVALGGKEKVASCALISGGAYRQLQEAALADVDCYVTGNFDEPAWHIAFEEKINFFALGHAATEKVGPRALTDYLRRLHNLDATFVDELNPF